MEAGKGLGNVILAAVFAAVVIGTAGVTYYLEHNGILPSLSLVPTANPDDTDGDGLTTAEEIAWHTDPAKADTDGDGAQDGAEVKAGTDPVMPGNSGNPYETWSGSTPTQAFAQSVASAQASISNGSEATAAAKAAAASVPLPNFEEQITENQLIIDDSVSTNLYAAIVGEMLKESLKVREYELDVFRRSIAERNHLGNPELKSAAAIYKRIEGGLIAMHVPSSMTATHLRLVNSMGTLANVVAAMGSWGGDPVAGIVYVDAFLKAESNLSVAVNAFFVQTSTTTQK